MENRGVRRWMVKISDWDPSPPQFSFLVSLLPPHEHHQITRFVKIDDRKRALVSRLLQYSLVHEVLKIPFNEIVINRTAEGKPYLDGSLSPDHPKLHFNVSHSGEYVGIASEHLYLVGLDIVDISVPKDVTPMEFIRNFMPYFTSLEWRNIMSAGTSEEVVVDFFRYWCLKEAYVKALGVGLGCGFDRVKFHHHDWSNISVYTDGKKSRDWNFQLFPLNKSYWVCIARGRKEPASLVDSRDRTLYREHFADDGRQGDHYTETTFTFLTVEQLIPDSSRDGYKMCDIKTRSS